MKKTGVIFLVFAMLLVPASFAHAQYPYSDVGKKSSHHEALEYLRVNGLIGGYLEGKEKQTLLFKPNAAIKRIDAAVMFYRVLDLKDPTNYEKIISGFKDLDLSNPLRIPIAASINEGIFKGENGYFMDGELNREQMASTIVRAFNLQYKENTDIKTNVVNVSSSHKRSVETLMLLGITSELNDFRPKEKVTRAQFVSFLYRTMKINGLSLYTNYGFGDTESVINYETMVTRTSFSDTMYTYAKKIPGYITNRSKSTFDELAVGADYSVLFPNTPVLVGDVRIRHIPQKDQLSITLYRGPLEINKLITYPYDKADDIPLPEGKSIQEIEKTQEVQVAQISEKNGLEYQSGTDLLFKERFDRNYTIGRTLKELNSVLSSKDHLNMEELVEILNWTIKTGKIYDGGTFLIYYRFEYGYAIYKTIPRTN